MEYLSNDNVTYIVTQLRTQLCMKDHVDNNFVINVIGYMKGLAKKYDTNDLETINNVTMRHLLDKYGPQYRVKDFIQNNNNQIMKTGTLPPSRMIRPKLHNITELGQQTAVQRSPVQITEISDLPDTDKTKSEETDSPYTEEVFMQDPQVIDAKPEFGPNFYYNKKTGMYFNKNYNVIYEPSTNRYFNSNNGKELSSSDNRTKPSIFYNLKSTNNISSDVINALNSQSNNLSYYDYKTGQTINKSVHNNESGAFNNVKLTSVNSTGNSLIKEYTISVDSRHRDIRAYPNSNNYQIVLRNLNTQFGHINNLREPIRNIVRFELVGGIVPNVLSESPSSSPDTYFLLLVNEITGVYSYSSPIAKNILGKLQFDLDLPFTANYLDVDPVRCIREYTPEPLSTPLTTLTINILNFNGNLVDFGDDTVRIRYWSTLGTNTTTFIYTWTPHDLTSGDIVYFRETTNANLDNEYDGIAITVLTPLLISVPIDSSGVAAGQAPNMFGPPVDPNNPLNSAGEPFPTVPPNDPDNPTEFFGFILKPNLQNSFTFRIISEDKNQSRVNDQELAAKVASY